MNDFTASNGRSFRLTPSGGLRIGIEGDSLPLANAELVDALREFFQADADERLGRWRWPENPDYVALPRERTNTPREKRRVRVIHEPSGDFMDTVEGSSLVGVFKDAARAYFDAHPEPKPWDDAKPGEVWVVSYSYKAGDQLKTDAFSVDSFGRFRNNAGVRVSLVDFAVADAHRIFPEVS